MKHSHGRCVVGDFDKSLHEGSIQTGHRCVLYFILHKSISIHFVHNSTRFYDKYVSSGNKKIYIDDDGSGVFPKQKVINLYNSKYQKNYSNQYYVLKKDYIKDTRIRLTYSRRKRKVIDYVYLNGSPYRDAKGSLQLRSFIYDAIINTAPRIGRI